MNQELRETQKKFCSRSIVTAIIVGFFAIAAGYAPVGKGLILGTLFSVVNFAIMGELLPYRIGRSRRNTFVVVICSIFARYALLAVPIVVGVKFPLKFNLCAAIVGIFMVQLMILADHLKSAFLLTRRKNI
jgi:hypothetical protein